MRNFSGSELTGTTPRGEEVDALIDRARQHPLGIDFLQKGMLDSVAAVFEVHAFVVDSARDRLRDPLA